MSSYHSGMRVRVNQQNFNIIWLCFYANQTCFAYLYVIYTQDVKLPKILENGVKIHGFLSRALVLTRYVDCSHVVWQCMVDCFVLFLVRMERIKRIGLVAAIRQKPG